MVLIDQIEPSTNKDCRNQIVIMLGITKLLVKINHVAIARDSEFNRSVSFSKNLLLPSTLLLKDY